ncbi:hypothetical protein PMAYCL1PPCAC_22214, partial [Pristionchus mayeri]
MLVSIKRAGFPEVPILMVRSIFIFSLLSQIVDACIPVQPGDLECPTPPRLRPPPRNSDTTIYSRLQGPRFEYGIEVFYCGHDMVTMADDPKAGPYELICRPYTGMFV